MECWLIDYQFVYQKPIGLLVPNSLTKYQIKYQIDYQFSYQWTNWILLYQLSIHFLTAISNTNWPITDKLTTD